MSFDVKRKVSEESTIVSQAAMGSTPVETPVPAAVPVEEAEGAQSSGGAFSQQKGGSVALSIKYLLDAMNAQIKSLVYKTSLSMSTIDSQSRATSLQSENLKKMGATEWIGGIVMGGLGILGGAFSLVGAGSLFQKNFQVDRRVKGLQLEAEKYHNYEKGLGGIMGTPGAPGGVVIGGVGGANPILNQFKGGVIGTPGAGAPRFANPGFGQPGHIADPKLREILEKMPQEHVDALRHAAANNADAAEVLKAFQKKSKDLNAQIQTISNEFTTHNIQWDVGIRAVTALTGAGSSLMDGVYVKPVIKELEANNVGNQAAASGAAAIVQELHTSIGASASSMMETIRLLQSQLHADIRG